MILHVHEVEIAGAVEAEFVREVERGREGGAAVAGVTGGAVADDAGRRFR